MTTNSITPTHLNKKRIPLNGLSIFELINYLINMEEKMLKEIIQSYQKDIIFQEQT